MAVRSSRSGPDGTTEEDMAFEYALDMVSSSPPGRIADLVRSDEDAALEPLPSGFAIGLSGVYCTVRTVSDRSAEIAEESYGLRPTVVVAFRIDKFRDEDGERTMRAALVRILGAEAGDAVLLANREIPVLRRRNGRGVLIDQWRPWFGDMLPGLGPAWSVGPDVPLPGAREGTE
jgi:hypothetical protein